jgi:hypothetical protein
MGERVVTVQDAIEHTEKILAAKSATDAPKKNKKKP